MTVRVLAFARLRELLGFGERPIDLPTGSTLDTLWSRLVRETPGITPLRASTRFARNGTVATGATPLRDGDEVALMPPVGGG